MKHSTNSAFSNLAFAALTVGTDGAIALNQPTAANLSTASTPDSKTEAQPQPTLKVRTTRRPQPLIKKQQPGLFSKSAKISLVTATVTQTKRETAQPEQVAVAHRVVAHVTVAATLAPAEAAKITVVPGKAALAVPAIYGKMRAAQQSRTSVSGRVVQVVEDGKGRIFGVRVELEGTELQAFAPFSRLGLAITEVHPLLNTVQAFKVIEVDESKGAIVFNRQAACSEQRLDRLIDAVKVGQLHSGKVRNIADCGAFVEITGSGASGMIHISKLPGQSLDAVKKGQEVKVTVVKINKAKHQLGLSLAE
ncbi:hypothetical protein BH11CYA1_BH11CYA1_47090 [soil metagenome]